MPSTISPILPNRASFNSKNFSTNLKISWPAASKIWGIPLIRPFTIAAIICGVASISKGIAVISPSIRAIIIFTANSGILGIASASASIMVVINCGKASISTGRALTMPSANPVTSCNAASTNNGIFSTKVSAKRTTASTTLGISSGSDWLNACAIAAIPSATFGKIFGIISPKLLTKDSYSRILKTEKSRAMSVIPFTASTKSRESPSMITGTFSSNPVVKE